MIKGIKITNFKSIATEQYIDFTANREENLKDQNVNDGVLKSIAVFGENGAGKTTILEAINSFLNEMVGKKDFVYFRNSFDKPTEFTFEFKFNEDIIEVSYSVVNDFVESKKIVDESIIINGVYVKIPKNDKLTQIPSDTLSLRHLYYNNMLKDNELNIVSKLISFLENSIYYKCDKKETVTFNSKTNFSIKNVLTRNDNLTNVNTLKRINKLLSYFGLFEISTESFSDINPDHKGNHEFIVSLVKYYNGRGFLIENESSGHKDLIMFMQFFDYIFNNPGFIFIDEFNSSFHTELSKLLINLFNKNSINSQFIFVTQDTALMDSDVLRADQIYIINRNKDLESEFDRISNYQTRPTQNYQKMYRSAVISKQPLFKRLYDEEE